MTDYILPADKKFRKQVIITSCIAVPICIGILFCFWLYFHQLVSVKDTLKLIAKVRVTTFWFAFINIIVSVLLSAYFLFLAVKTFKFNMFPPPGTRVVRNTKIKFGRQAKIFGLLLIFAALLALSTNGIMYYLLHVLKNLTNQINMY